MRIATQNSTNSVLTADAMKTNNAISISHVNVPIPTYDGLHKFGAQVAKTTYVQVKYSEITVHSISMDVSNYKSSKC